MTQAAFAIRAREGVLAELVSPGRPGSEALLLAACRAGDRGAFEELYRLHADRMKSIAAQILGRRDEAEDAVQDAFVRIFRSIGAFEGRSRFSTWIYRIVVNACRDRLRRRRDTSPLEDEGDPRHAARGSDPALRLVLEQGLRSLPERQRAAFVLFAVEGFAHREIAEILDVSAGNSKTLVFEAKRKLARFLAGRRPERAA